MESVKIVSVKIKFSTEDKRLIKKVASERVGSRTIAAILDEYSYVFGFYVGMFNALKKVFAGDVFKLTHDEYNALTNILSAAYNDAATPDAEKAHIREICDALQAQHDAELRCLNM